MLYIWCSSLSDVYLRARVAAYETVFWYTGRLAHRGQLLRMKVHAHNTLFDESLFFAAAPEDLGLTDDRGLVSPREVSDCRVQCSTAQW